MFYVASFNRESRKFGVIDTNDGVEEFYTEEELLSIVDKNIAEIDGVDTREKHACIVKPTSETLKLFKQGNFHLALSTMSISNQRIEVMFQSKRTIGGMTQVLKHIINVARSGVNRYSFDKGYSKSFRCDLTLDDIMMVFENMQGSVVNAGKASY